MSEFTNRVSWLVYHILELMKRSLLSCRTNYWYHNEQLTSFLMNAREVFPRETKAASTIAAVRFHRWAVEQQEAKRIKSWLENEAGQ